MMKEINPTGRFTDRVDNYAQYRPSYPDDAIAYITSRGILPSTDVADIGSGTGIMTRLLLPHCRTVFAVEPNEAMRNRAEVELSNQPGFRSISGTAESTGLESASVGAIVCAQAYHWFDSERTRREFRRVLGGPRLLFLVWNNRINDTPFLKRYDELLHQYGSDYAQVNHQRLGDRELESVFSDSYEKAEFANEQRFDLAGVIGRLDSSSYVPPPEDPRHRKLVREVEEAFGRYSSDGTISFHYSTTVYSGTMR